MGRKGYVLTPVRDRLGEHAYDSFLTSQPAGDFLQTRAWGRVKLITGWRANPVLLQDGDGKVVLSALLLARKIPGLPVNLFYAPRGPVLDWDLPPELLAEVLRAFAAAVRQLGGRTRSVLLKCDPALPADNEAAAAALKGAGFRVASAGLSFEGLQPRFVYEIDITPPEEALLGSFSAKHRYNIRLAGRKGVEVRRTEDIADMTEFYRVLQVTAERDGFNIRNLSYYEAIWREVVATGGAHLFLAEYEGEILSGALIFTLGKRGWYVYGASSNEHRNLMPNYALHWEIMRFLKERGHEIYDMRGISGDLTPGSHLYGLYRFKKGFAGRVVEYRGEMDLPLVRPVYWAVKAALPLYRSLMRLRSRSPADGASGASRPSGGTNVDAEDAGPE